MPFLLSEATSELKRAVQDVEDLADKCYELLRLLRRPANEARWSLLTAMALELEMRQQKFGPNRPFHKIAMVVLDRCACGFKFVTKHGRPASRLVQKYAWHGSLVQDATHALSVSEQYMHFESAFPMWHKNHEKVDIQPDGRVRFYMPRDSSRQRQVIAFQQSFRPRGSAADPPPYTGQKNIESPEAKRLLDELWHTARPGGTAKKFSYEPSWEIIEALRPKYQSRLDENFRHPDTFRLNGYSLCEFKSFYIAFLILCSIHEYLCYPFDKPGQPIPVSSLVMVKPRSVWTSKLSQISGLSRELCDAIVSDLTLDPVAQSGASMCIYPFVPLDTFALAVAPQFPLVSAVDDNVLRSFSYRSPALFSAQNTEKESIMSARIKEAAVRFWADQSIELPDKTTEIDVLLVDETSSTVVLAELKWSRKPNRTLEVIDRDKEIAKGLAQLQLIRSYTRAHPDFLRERGKLQRSLASYADVHYLLVVWDHWFWIDPEDGIAVVNLDALIPGLKKDANLQNVVTDLLRYEWLPVEGRDFRVNYAAATANGAVMESAKFSPAILG
jgi:hypothetical protein